MVGANDNNREKIGAIRTYLGQRYQLVGLRAHCRADGSMTTLAEWNSRCAECGAPFQIRVPARASKFQPNRRCQRHKRPGHKVVL